MSVVASLKEIGQQLFVTPSIRTSTWSYDNYWQMKRGEAMGIANEYQKQRAAWIAERIQPEESMLDIGCGDGAVLLELKRHLSVKVLGAELSDYALAHLEQCGIEAFKFDLGDPESIERLPEVDHILLLEVLEHIPNPEEFLLEIKSKARKSVIFSFPNTGFISYRLRLLFGRFPVQWRVSPGEHLRFWTYRDLHWWLNELGLYDQAQIACYAGVSGLNRLWPAMFGAALIAKIPGDAGSVKDRRK